MDSERYRIIPRKKGQSLYTILMAIVYISAFAMVFIWDGLNLTYFIIGLLVLSIGFSFLEYFLWRLNWQKLGELSGLNPEETSFVGLFKAPRLAGSYRGYRFLLSSFTVGYGRYKKHYTKMEMELPVEIEGSFSVVKKNFLQSNLDLTGIEEFDKRFTLKTSMEWVKSRLFQNREIQEGLYDLHKQCRSMQLSASSSQLSFQERGRIKDAEYLMALMDYLVKMAVIIKQNS